MVLRDQKGLEQAAVFFILKSFQFLSLLWQSNRAR